MTFAKKLLSSLSNEVEYIFSVPGRTIFPFLKSANDLNMNNIICASETGAGFMAEGYAKASNKYGVAIIVAGPGFSNIFPSIVNAYYDNTRVLFIVGTAETFHSGKNMFQDSSIYQLNGHNLSVSLTSYSCIMNTNDYTNHYANSMFNLKYKTLPVLINVPLDVQIFETKQLPLIKPLHSKVINTDALMHIKEIILTNSVLIVTGNRSVKSKVIINKFCEKFLLPVASTLCAKGSVNELQENYLGIFGFGMSPRVFDFLNDSRTKYIITIGVDINERNTYQWSNFPQQIIHLDEEIISNSRDHYFVNNSYISDIDAIFDGLIDDNELEVELQKTRYIRKQLLDDMKTPIIINTPHNNDSLYVDNVLKVINNAYYVNTDYVTDSGLHRLYCAQILRISNCCGYYNSINNGHMGWAIAASLGVKLANQQNDCICITGDGCMLMTGIEIQTAAKYKIKVLFIVLNNGAHGAIKNANKQYSHIGLSDHQYDIPNHNWALFANSLGVPSLRINTEIQLNAALEMFKHTDEPLLLDINCYYDDEVNINWYYEEFIRQNRK